MRYKLIFILLFILSCSYELFATHNRAGDITYRHINGLTYEISVTIFADPNSPAFRNRDEIEVNWGDNTAIDSIGNPLVGPDIPNRPNVKARTWVARHTFPGPGNYRVRVEDRNRNDGVDNIDGSVNVPFTIQSLIRISPIGSQFNNSVFLRNDPIDDACAGELYVYNPGAFDPDGDSIAYELAPSLGTGGFVAPGFTFPTASISLSVDPKNGDLIWNTPNQVGLYNLAIKIKEYRNGILIGEVLRDMQIQVIPGCNNRPPNIFVDQFTCVEAGDTLILPIESTDPDAANNVSLSVTGEIVEVPISNRVSFNAGVPGNPTLAELRWNTICDDVRKNLYNLSIKAEDNAFPVVLSNFRNASIRVVAPAPENLTTTPFGQTIELNWLNTKCQNASGYRIYRRVDSSGFVPDSCTIGVPDDLGFVRIAELSDLNQTNFIDDNGGRGLIPGIKYCYLVTKYFDDGDESLASNEACDQIDKVVPVITKVSVINTNETNGIIDLEWSPPNVIDASVFPPPYRYLIYETLPNDANIIIDSTNSINDTTLTISQINTLNQDHAYFLEMYSIGSGRSFMGNTAIAYSIFLNITATDNLLRLNWSDNVPWVNDSFTVFRMKPNASVFDSLTTVNTSFYNDSNLSNGLKYCYYIKSFGKYNLKSVKSPLINLSQERCSTPVDNIEPCAPDITINASCEGDSLSIYWNNPNNSCADDVLGYRIYYAPNQEGENRLISEINSPDITTFSIRDRSIAGCYSITSIDSVGNESTEFDQECIEYCPIYELPNVFSPNNDNRNDLYIPILPYRDVDSINLVVYNRWGDVVFETRDPDIKWNGLHKGTKEILSSGVYYYSCEVYEKSLEPMQSRSLKGTITIFNPETPIDTN